MARDPEVSGVLPPELAVDPRRRDRRVPRHRHVPVLLLLGNDVGADVLPDRTVGTQSIDRKSTRLNSSHTEIYTLSYTTLFRSRDRRVPRHRHVPVLLLLGNDVGADVLPDRTVGTQS